MQVAVPRVVETGLPLVYVNQCGGQDELVFDGGSFGLHADRTLAFQMPQFEEAVAIVTWKKRRAGRLALRRRALRRRCPDSRRRTGGPASSGCATTSTRTASRASCSASPAASTRRSSRRWRSTRSGTERVHCVMLPYRYTAQESLSDAAAIAATLGVRYDIVPIDAPVEGFEAALKPVFAGSGAGHHRGEPASRARAAPS